MARKRRCPRGHHWNGHQCVKTVKRPKAGPPVTVPGQPTATTEPLTGEVSSVVATPGNEGVDSQPGGGDLTGTSALTDAVFSQGAGVAPQLHYDSMQQQQEQQAQQMIASPEGNVT